MSLDRGIVIRRVGKRYELADENLSTGDEVLVIEADSLDSLMECLEGGPGAGRAHWEAVRVEGFRGF